MNNVAKSNIVRKINSVKESLVKSLLKDLIEFDSVLLTEAQKQTIKNLPINILAIKSLEDEDEDDTNVKIRVLRNLLNEDFYGYENPRSEEIAKFLIAA